MAPARPIRLEAAWPVLTAEVTPQFSTADWTFTIATGTTCYVCRSPVFADAAAAVLMQADVDSQNIRFERFGPTG